MIGFSLLELKLKLFSELKLKKKLKSLRVMVCEELTGIAIDLSIICQQLSRHWLYC